MLATISCNQVKIKKGIVASMSNFERVRGVTSFVIVSKDDVAIP